MFDLRTVGLLFVLMYKRMVCGSRGIGLVNCSLINCCNIAYAYNGDMGVDMTLLRYLVQGIWDICQMGLYYSVLRL